MSAKFRFRLDPVLAHRERLEDERRRAFAEKQRDLSAAEAEQQRLEAERDSQRRELRNDHKAFDGDRLRATYAHLAFLDRAIEDQAERVAACAAEASRAQRGLIEAGKDRKVLETLKSHRRATFDAAATLADQRESDDQNARLFGRAHPRGTPP